MKNSNSTNSPSSSDTAAPRDAGTSPWQQLKGKRIAYLTLPLLVMATITEFVILATGWKYQQAVCLPQGMGVTFFGIGPIGATILAVELLKLPLAIWTASRYGWQKGFMLIVGLPLICVLTFQLVKDMAVYEMGTAMAPASQFLEKAAAEEVKIAQLNAELENQNKDDSAVKGVIEEKKAVRDRKLGELAAKQGKAKAELEESLKRNDATRQDAITLTDYQKKELSEADTRQATIIKQFDADAEQLNKAIGELRVRREAELGRATTWNAEEARIENAYKAKLAAFTNKKRAYDKEKSEYDNANFIKRQLMKEPIDPGVPPEREVNKVLKPTLVAELEAQIKAKEAELVTVNNKRRDRVAQVDTDARRLREDFDRRSGTKREESDRKREELLAAMAALVKEGTAEAKLIDQEFDAAVQKEQDSLKNRRPLDVVRAELDASRKKADGFYEAREASIRKTQVHRIATTVEIVRGLLMGERPMSIKATAKERGDILTDQISMVRIWVYPVLAFIVAFLPTLMVEIGFSTVFKPEQQRPAHRLGFFGRGLHQLYIRAGRQKILRAERLASEASAEIDARDKALATANAAAEKALAEVQAELQAAREANSAAAAGHEEQLARKKDEHAQQFKKKEAEWIAKFTDMADSLNRTVIEKDALRDLQKSEIERQIQMRQNAWSDRITQLRQELDDQRAAAETERSALMQEQHRKLMEVTEDCKTQVAQGRRQIADSELASLETTARLSHDLKEALSARDAAESQLQHQGDSFALQLSQGKEDATREVEKAVRQEKHRFERRQMEFEKALRQRDEDIEHRLKQQEQELSLAFGARLEEEKARAEQKAQRREAELERQLESRASEVEARWKQELQQREETAQTKLKQREQQLQSQADVRLSEVQAQADEELRRRESEFERQFNAQGRETEARLLQELQQKELAFHARLKQREQELAAKAAAREAELQNQWAAELRAREQQWEQQNEVRLSESQTRADEELRQREMGFERQLDTQSREADARLREELQQKELAFHARLKQREQELAAKAAAREAELQNQWAAELRAREQQWVQQNEVRLSESQTRADEELRQRELGFERQLDTQSREGDARLREELQQKELAFHAKVRQREQELIAKAAAREAELQNQWSSNLRTREEEWQQQTESRVRATESRLAHESQQKEDLLQMKIRQREQQLQSQFDARHAELRAQWDQELSSREQEWQRNLEADTRATESRWLADTQAKEELFQSKLRQRDQQWQVKFDAARADLQTQSEELRRREADVAGAKQLQQDLVSQLTDQAEAHQTAQKQWETELEITRGNIEPLKVLLARTEKERDEARQSATEGGRQVQDLEEKLMEASSLLTGWKNGKNSGGVRGGRDAFQVARGGLGVSEEQ